MQPTPVPSTVTSSACVGQDQVPAGAIDAKTFELAINKPETAVPVSPQTRAENLRTIFSRKAGLVDRFIVTEVSHDGQNGNAIFRITFKTNPDHKALAAHVENVLKQLTPERVIKIVSDGTGLKPELIEVRPHCSA